MVPGGGKRGSTQGEILSIKRHFGGESQATGREARSAIVRTPAWLSSRWFQQLWFQQLQLDLENEDFSNSTLPKKISADADCSMILPSRGLALTPTFTTFPLAGTPSAILSVASRGSAYRRRRGLSAGVERRQFRDERAVAERLG